MPLTWRTSRIKLLLFSLRVDTLAVQNWVVFKVKGLVTLVKFDGCTHKQQFRPHAIDCVSLYSFREENRSRIHMKMPHKRLSAAPDVALHCCSCCITLSGYEFIQCFSTDTLCIKTFRKQNRRFTHNIPLFQLFMLYLYDSHSLFSFWEEKNMKDRQPKIHREEVKGSEREEPSYQIKKPVGLSW